ILVPTLLPFSFTPPPPSALSTLSLHDALPICAAPGPRPTRIARGVGILLLPCHRGLRPRPEGIHESQTQSSQWSVSRRDNVGNRSEEHTSELQSLAYLVCRLLLEKKKTQHNA